MAEAYAIMPLDEVQGVACLAAVGCHAAEQAFAWCDDEIRGLFIVVEGAESRPVFALLFEFHTAALDEGYEVGV